MHVYYCRKCKRDSASPVCEHCGVQITSLNQNERFRWRTLRVPLGDTQTVLGALKVLFFTLLVLTMVLFIGELLFSQNKASAVNLLTMGGLLPWMLIFLAAGAGLILLVLGLQGQEEMHYVIDYHGAHLQTWIVPGRIKCYARFLPYEEYNIVPGPDGEKRLMISESHLVWEDVCRCEVSRRAGRIDLYRPSGFKFMSIYPEREEMDAVVNYMNARMKHLVKK